MSPIDKKTLLIALRCREHGCWLTFTSNKIKSSIREIKAEVKPSSNKLSMVTIKFNKKDNEISMARVPVEDDLIERNAQIRFWFRSKRKLQGIISVITIAIIIVGVSVIKHKRSISSQYDNERYHYFFIEN